MSEILCQSWNFLCYACYRLRLYSNIDSTANRQQREQGMPKPSHLAQAGYRTKRLYSRTLNFWRISSRTKPQPAIARARVGSNRHRWNRRPARLNDGAQDARHHPRENSFAMLFLAKTRRALKQPSRPPAKLDKDRCNLFCPNVCSR